MTHCVQPLVSLVIWKPPRFILDKVGDWVVVLIPLPHHWTEMVLPCCAVSGSFLVCSSRPEQTFFIRRWSCYHGHDCLNTLSFIYEDLPGCLTASQSTKHQCCSQWSVTGSNDCRFGGHLQNCNTKHQGLKGHGWVNRTWLAGLRETGRALKKETNCQSVVRWASSTKSLIPKS